MALPRQFEFRAIGRPVLPTIPKTPIFDIEALLGVEAFEAAELALDSEADINPRMEQFQATTRAIAHAIKDPATRARSTWLLRTLVNDGGIWTNTMQEVIYYRGGAVTEAGRSWRLVARLSMLLIAVAVCRPASAQQSSSDASAQSAAQDAPSPWLLVPVFSSSPKLGTSIGGLGAYLHKFDPDSRVSLFGVMYQYSSTHSQIAAAFVRTSSGADHHRIVFLIALGHIKNDYSDYLGTGQPLQTEDDFKAVAARYLFRTKADWFIGAQANAANYQVLGATPEGDFVLETLGLRGFDSAAVGAVLMHDSRDSEDMPTGGWFLNVNNLAYLKCSADPRRSTRIAWTSARSGNTAAVTCWRRGSTTG